MSDGTIGAHSAPRMSRSKHGPFIATLVAGVIGLAIVSGVMWWGSQPGVRIEFVWRPLRAALLSVLALWCVVYGIWRGPLGWRSGAVLLLATYLGIETLSASAFSRVFELATYTALQDPDHRPRHTQAAKGWNSDSLRCPHEATDFVTEGTNVVFLGDSYTFGMRLRAKECFPAVVENRLRARYEGKDVKVANFAWVSSSPLLSWRRLLDIGDKYAPDLVVLCLDMTDIRDDIRWRDMLERRGMYWLIGRLPLAMRAIEVISPTAYDAMFAKLNPDLPAGRFFMSEAPLEETRPYFAELVKNLARIQDWCDERGARFITIVLPRTYQYSDREAPENWEAAEYTVLGPYSLEPFRFFDELRSEVDYPIYSLLETFQRNEVFPTSFEDDPHWNPAGAQVAAKAVQHIIADELSALGLP